MGTNYENVVKGLRCWSGEKACDLCIYDELVLEEEEKTCVNLVAEDALELIFEQKAEIERLTEELNKQRNLYLKEFGSNANALAKNAELQSKIDKLKERNYWLESEHEYQCEKSYFEGVEKGKEQAEKYTAKDIYDFAKDFFEWDEEGFCSSLKDWLKERYGVEVKDEKN